MKLVEKMKDRIAKRPDLAGTKLEREQRQQEKGAAKRMAARSQPHDGFEMPLLPERPAELTEMAARRAQLSRDREAIETELAQLQEKNWRDQNLDDTARDAAAEALAAGETEATEQGVVPQHLEVLLSRLDLVRRAEAKLGKKIVDGNARHNRSIANALRPQHRRAVRRIHAALLELESANAEELAVRCAVPGAPLENFSFPKLGTRGPNGGGLLQYWIGYARRLGMLTEDPAQALAAAE